MFAGGRHRRFENPFDTLTAWALTFRVAANIVTALKEAEFLTSLLVLYTRPNSSLGTIGHANV